MAQKRSDKNNDELGCLFGLFEVLAAVLMLLFSSKDPTARKVGWGIVGVIAVFGVLTSEGVSGEAAMAVVGGIAVVVIVVWAVMALIKNSENNPPSGGAAFDKNNSSSSGCVTAAAKPVGNEISGEQLSEMEPKGRTSNLKDKYYSSVQEALEDYTVPVGYRKIVIERIQRTDIKGCPGLLWKDSAMLYVLPLLRKTKIYSVNGR